MATAQYIRRELSAPFAGMDRYNHRTKMRDISAYTMKNMWSPTVGVYRKRLEPALVATLAGMSGYRANGMTEYTDSLGTIHHVVACGGKLFDSTAEGTFGSAISVNKTPSGTRALSTTNTVRFWQYDGTLYGCDGNIYFKYDGTTATEIIQPSTKGPIEPGTVTIKDATVAKLTDAATAGELKTPAGADKGDISYTDGAGVIDAGFISGACTADYTSGTAKTELNFARVAIDGTLENPCTIYGDIGYMTLTDGTNTLHTSTTDYANTDILDSGSNVVGSIDRTNGKIQVTSAGELANSTAITATYSHTKVSVSGSETHVVSLPLPCAFTLAHAPIKPKSVVLTDSAFGYSCSDPAGDGVLTDAGGTINYATGEVSITAVGGGPPPDTTTWTCTYDYYSESASAEAVGTSASDGKFEKIYLANVPAISGYLTLNDGDKAIVANASNLFDGATDVGGWEKSTGEVYINTVSVFTAGAMVDAYYYEAVATTAESIADPTSFILGGTTTPVGPTDLVWLKNKMWLACGKLLYKSDSLLPETFSTAPYELKGGKGTKIMRLLPHRKDRIICFKGDGSSRGSIHPIDISSDTVSEWQANVYFDDVNLCSPDAIVRSDQREGADIFIPTREGLRTLSTSDQDNITGTSQPIDLSISTLIGSPTNAHYLASWAIMYKGEYLRWINDKCYALNLNMPRESLQDAWTYMEMAASGATYGIEADCGCVCDFGSGPQLYIGGPAGTVVKMFSAQTYNFTGLTEHKALCALVDGQPSLFVDIVPHRVGVRVDDSTTGLYYAFLVGDAGTVYSLGGNNVGTATAVITSDVSEGGTIAIPLNAFAVRITFRTTKVNATLNWDELTLHSPTGATYSLDVANVSSESTTGATVNLVGPALETGWTLSWQVRCTV